MGIKEEIEEEVARIKSQLSIAHDNGDKYALISLRCTKYPFTWSQMEINEILRSMNDVDAFIISHTYGQSPTSSHISFLFELIYI